VIEGGTFNEGGGVHSDTDHASQDWNLIPMRGINRMKFGLIQYIIDPSRKQVKTDGDLEMITSKGIKSRQKIITSALQLFQVQGYRQTSVSDICGKAGIATGTFYHYYKSKQDILAGYIEHANQEVLDYYHNLHSGTISELFLQVVDFKASLYTVRGPELVNDLYSALVTTHAYPFDLYEYTFFHISAELYQRGIAAGEFRSEVDPQSFADTAACIFFYSALVWSQQTSPSDLREVLASKFGNLLILYRTR
jgi:AcrR family transcriptional regulator